jgi:nucleoside-diphosphate-sugar epimerase
VTGGAGFIGSHLVAHLIQKGHFISVLDNFSSSRRENLAGLKNVRVLKGDVRNFAQVLRATKNTDTVFHLAALVSVPESVQNPLAAWEINVRGTCNVLEAARRMKTQRVIFASSAAVYGESGRLPVNEDSPLRPQSPYALSKRIGEELFLTYGQIYGLQPVILRFFNLFGPRQDHSSPYAGAIVSLTRRLLNDRRPIVHGDGKQTRDFLHVEEAVRVMEKAALSGKASNQIINVGSGKSISINRLLTEIQKILKTNLLPKKARARPGDLRHSQADIRRAQKLLGALPKADFSQALKKTVHWYRDFLV